MLLPKAKLMNAQKTKTIREQHESGEKLISSLSLGTQLKYYHSVRFHAKKWGKENGININNSEDLIRLKSKDPELGENAELIRLRQFRANEALGKLEKQLTVPLKKANIIYEANLVAQHEDKDNAFHAQVNHLSTEARDYNWEHNEKDVRNYALKLLAKIQPENEEQTRAHANAINDSFLHKTNADAAYTPTSRLIATQAINILLKQINTKHGKQYADPLLTRIFEGYKSSVNNEDKAKVKSTQTKTTVLMKNFVKNANSTEINNILTAIKENDYRFGESENYGKPSHEKVDSFLKALGEASGKHGLKEEFKHSLFALWSKGALGHPKEIESELRYMKYPSGIKEEITDEEDKKIAKALMQKYGPKKTMKGLEF
ncbi:MAG: hypothetical protein ABH803_02730 [Candidatus Micrarchaeota archaeon]